MPVGIGYIVMAHTLPEHLVRLVGRLRGDGARFFIHIDRRSPRSVMETVRRGLADDRDVVFLPRRACHWADFSQVQVSLDGVRAVLAASEGLDYGVLLTGQDYPLRPPRQIQDTLGRAGGGSFMSWRPATGRFLDRLRGWHWHRTIGGRRLRIPNRFVPLPIRRPLPEGMDAYYGSAYWCLSRPCLEHVLRVSDTRPDVVSFFRRSSSPDESFFQMLLCNSHLAETVVNDDLRYVDWSDNASSPRVLTCSDLDAVLQSRALFARKFDPRVDPVVLDRLDAHLDSGARR